MAKGYIISKEKNTEKVRPIVSYAGHLWRVALNMTAQIIAFLLKCTRMDKTVVWDVFEVEKIVRE